ncbi:excalibur calcium-binding domain-containing protein [Mycolicibacterium septicum]|nr:excalibur calcium-binding domain-containing protein [Mycolicibacterium septicum]
MVRFLLIAAVIAVSALGLTPVAAARPYANCTQAHQDGRYDIPQDDPAYWDGGDRDHDGYACDS